MAQAKWLKPNGSSLMAQAKWLKPNGSSQGNNLALTGLLVPSSLDSG